MLHLYALYVWGIDIRCSLNKEHHGIKILTYTFKTTNHPFYRWGNWGPERERELLWHQNKAQHAVCWLSGTCYFQENSKPLLQPALLPTSGQMGVGGFWAENAHDTLSMWGKWGPRRFHQECHGRGTHLQEHLSVPDDTEIARNGLSSWRNSQTGTGIWNSWVSSREDSWKYYILCSINKTVHQSSFYLLIQIWYACTYF